MVVVQRGLFIVTFHSVAMSATPWTVSERGDDDMLTYFISVGVDINRKNGVRWLPAHFLCPCPSSDLCSTCNGAAAAGAAQMGVSPLHLAALHGHTSTVRLLVDAGALVNVRNSLVRSTPRVAARFELSDARFVCVRPAEPRHAAAPRSGGQPPRSGLAAARARRRPARNEQSWRVAGGPCAREQPQNRAVAAPHWQR